MKRGMKSTARLAVTAGLCTSLALGGLPLEAIAAEAVVEPAQAGTTTAANATEDSGEELTSSDPTPADDAAADEGVVESDGAGDAGDSDNTAAIGGEAGDEVGSVGTIDGVSQDPATTLSAVPVSTADPKSADVAQVIAADGTVRGAYDSLNTAVDAAQDGDTVKLLGDATLKGYADDNRYGLGVVKGITLDGGGNTVDCGKYGRGIYVEGSGDANCPRQVTFMNVAITNHVDEGRCIDTRGGYFELTLDDAHLETTGAGNNQALTIGGDHSNLASGHLAPVVITGKSTIEAGDAGYGILTFNPVDLSIVDESKIDGYAALYLKGENSSAGSSGSKIRVADKATICSRNVHNDESSTFGTVVFEDKRISLEIDGATARASTDYVSQVVFGYGVDITGCSVRISGDSRVELAGDEATFADEPTGGTIEISGGTFNFKLEDRWCAPDFRPIDNGDGTFGVAEKKVAQIGDKTYPSLAKAVDAAQDGDTVTLLEDVLSDGGAVIGGERSITLDLNGKTLDCGSGQIVVEDKANLTFTGGGELKNSATVDSVSSYVVLVRKGAHATFDGAGIAGAYCLYALGDVDIVRANMEATGGCAIAVNGSARVVVGSKDATAAENNKNVVVTSANNCISTRAKEGSKDSKVTVYGGTFTGATNPDNPSDPWNCGPVYWASHGTLDIRDGVFTTAAATAAVLQKNGTVKVSGGTFEAKDGFKIDATQQDTTEIVTEIADGTFTGTRAGIYVNAGTGGPIDYAKNFSVKVKGGTFKGGDKERAIYVKPAGAAAAGTKPLEISGGTFDEAVDADYCAPNYVPETTPDADGNYTVEVPADKQVAEIDGRAYPSVQEALDAAKDGQTVELIKDVAENVVIAEGKNVVLDLGGFKLAAPLTDGANKTSTITVKGSLVLKDSTATDAPVVNTDGSITYVSGSVVCPKLTVKPYARPVIVEPGGSFTLESGRLYAEDSDGVFVGTAGAEAGGSMVMKGGLIDAQEYGIGVISHSSLIVEGGLVRARNNAAVAGNGAVSPSQGDTNIAIKGGLLRSESTSSSYIACGVYHPQAGTLTVTGGKIEAVGGVGILMRAGSANITGGEVVASGSMSGYVGDSKVEKVPSSGIVVDRAANYGASTEDDVVNVSGSAMIKADKGQDALSTVLDENDSKKGLIAVSGGELSSKPDLEYCADGYGPVQQPDGSFGVSTEQSYTVKHLFEAVDSDEYVVDESLAPVETLTGTIGRPTEAEPVNVKGFTAQPVEQKTIAADGSTIVEVRYDRTRHAVSFDSRGGSAATEQAVKYGAKAAEPAKPTKEGSTFLGWYVSGTFNKFDFNTPVTEDIQLVAHWVLNTYTVTLDANGGEPIEPIEMSHGCDLAEPTATRTGYTLTGWKGTDGKDVTFPVTVTGDLELTAQWKLDAPKVALTADKAEPGVHAGDTVTLTANPEHALDGVTYTYQWYKGREKIDGAIEKTLKVSNKDGEYTVDVVAHDGKNASAAAISNSITLAFEKQGVVVSFAQAEVEKHASEIGDTFVNGIALQARAIGDVSYESSDNAVATVDAKTGEVTIQGVGEATITAKVAETETHEAAGASYKLTVTDHDAGTWKTVKPATCTEAGEEQRVCGVCGEVLETRAIEKLTHAAAHVPAKAATCTEDGNIEHWSCESCGKLFADAACTDEIELTDTVEKALGHDCAEIVVDPTCTEDGYTVHECQRCGDSYTDSKTEALGHAEKLVGAADATCTEDGYTGDMVCSACGEVLRKGEVVPAAGHKVGAWKVAKEPTCTEAGREERTCSMCGEKESREIPSLGHKLEAVAEIPATIDAAGVKAHYKCTACGELFLDAEGKQGVDAAGLVIEKLEAVTVTFDDCFDPDTDQIVIRLAKGGVIADEDLPADPEHAGYEFAGWFLYDTTTHSWGDAFNPTAPVTADLLVGAKWKKVDEGTGDSGSTEKPADKPTKPSDEPGSGDKDALVQTGDSAFAQIVAAFSAGVAAIGAGLFSRRRRNE